MNFKNMDLNMNFCGNQNVITNMAKNCLISVLIHVIAEMVSVNFQRISQRKNDVKIAVSKHSRDINESFKYSEKSRYSFGKLFEYLPI